MNKECGLHEAIDRLRAETSKRNCGISQLVIEKRTTICYIYLHNRIGKESGVIFRLSLVQKDMLFMSGWRGGVVIMNTMEVLTLLLVIFTALAYIDGHNKRK